MPGPVPNRGEIFSDSMAILQLVDWGRKIGRLAGILNTRYAIMPEATMNRRAAIERPRVLDEFSFCLTMKTANKGSKTMSKVKVDNGLAEGDHSGF